MRILEEKQYIICIETNLVMDITCLNSFYIGDVVMVLISKLMSEIGR